MDNKLNKLDDFEKIFRDYKFMMAEDLFKLIDIFKDNNIRIDIIEMYNTIDKFMFNIFFNLDVIREKVKDNDNNS